MGLINLIRNAGAIARTAWTADQWPGWISSGSGIGPSAMLSVPGIDRPAENVLMVYGCLTARREAIGGVGLRITDSRGEVVESGPLVALLDKPNATMNWDQYVRVLETYNTLYNAIVIAKVADAGGLPDELVPLSPGYLTPTLGVHGPTGTPVAMEYQYHDPSTGASRIYKPEDLIIHFGFNPHAPLEALSPLKVLRRTMQGELAAREQNAALFLNDSTPKFVLTKDGPMTKEQADEVRSQWEDRYMGFANRHKTAILWGGLKSEVLGLSPKEMEFLESLKFCRTDYYIVFRISPAMLGEMTGETGLSQGSSTEAQKVQWWEDIGLSELDLIAGLHQELAQAFAGRGLSTRRAATALEREARARYLRRTARQRQTRAAAGMEIWFDDNTIPALVRHRLAKLEQFTKICALGYPPNDINEFLNLGLPDHPTNIGTVPMGVQPVEDLRDAPAPAAGGNALKPDGETQREHPLLARGNAIVARLEREALERASRVDRTRKAFVKFIAPREKAAARKWSRYFIEQRERVLGRIGRSGAEREAGQKGTKNLSADYADLRRLKGEGELSRGLLEDAVDAVFDLNAENKSLIERIGPLFVEHLKDGWEFFNKQDVGLDDKANPFAIDDPRVMRALDARKIQGTMVNQTTEENLREIVRTSFNEGLSTREMGDRIAQYYAENCVGETSARPLTAARTQTAGIVNEGRMASAQKVGGLRKIWIHGNPNEPRPSHMEAAARYQANPIPLDQAFEVDGESLMQPGDANASVGNIANCTCSVGFVPG